MDEEKNTTVKCRYCGKIIHVDFGYRMRTGWPKCCNYTMDLIDTTVNIKRAAEDASVEQANLLDELIKG